MGSIAPGALIALSTEIWMLMTRNLATRTYLSDPWAFHPPKKSRDDFSTPNEAVDVGRKERPECGVQ